MLDQKRYGPFILKRSKIRGGLCGKKYKSTPPLKRIYARKSPRPTKPMPILIPQIHDEIHQNIQLSVQKKA